MKILNYPVFCTDTYFNFIPCYKLKRVFNVGFLSTGKFSLSIVTIF